MVKNIDSSPTISMVKWKSAIKGEDQDLEHETTREIAKGDELLLLWISSSNDELCLFSFWTIFSFDSFHRWLLA